MMSIAQFAARTGMVPSALRFYESKGILIPAERHDNGYRFYGYHQIQTAKLVNSLRQSGISLGIFAVSWRPMKVRVFSFLNAGGGTLKHVYFRFRLRVNI